MKYVMTTIVFVLFHLPALSQNENKHWFYRNGRGLIFNDTIAHQLHGVKRDTTIFTGRNGQRYYSTINNIHTVMSDKKKGDLLFYTVTDVVYNKYHQVMENGGALFGLYGMPNNSNNLDRDIFGRVGLLPVPLPFKKETYDSKIFYLFTINKYDNNSFGKMYYSIIDMRDGIGKVTRRNVYIRDSIGSEITGTIDCTTGNYWIIVSSPITKKFYAYKLTENGLDNIPIVSNLQKPSKNTFFRTMKLSPDGKKIAVMQQNSTSIKDSLFIFNFNTQTGVVDNKRFIPFIEGNELRNRSTISFSSNSKILYLQELSYETNREEYDNVSFSQFDITNDIPKMTFKTNVRFGFWGDLYSYNAGNCALQLGMDKKIYSNSYIIHSPNTLGSGCDIRYAGFIRDTANDAAMRGEAPLRDSIIDPYNDIVQFPNMMEHTMSDSYGLAGMRSNYCMEFPGTIDTVYGCIGKPIKMYHKDAGRVLFRKWTINNADIIEQGLDSIVFSVNQKGIYPIQLNSVKQSRSDVLRTVAIVDDIPKVDAGKDIYACDSVQIGSAGEKNVQYSWTPTEGLNNPNIPNPIAAAPKKEIKYSVRAFTKGGCENYDEIIVRPGIPVQPIINRDTIICLGNSVPLQAGGGTKYEWFPKSGLNNYFIANPIAMPRTTTRYKVIISNATCTDSAFVTITIKENEKADAGADRTLCAGLSVRLGTNNNPQVEYSWSPADYLDNPKSANPLCTPEKNMQYILTVKNSNGCENYDTVNVTLGGELSVFAGADTSVCKGEQIQLNASGAENFTWSPAEGLSNATIANPIFTGTSTTQYIVTGKSGNCEGKDTILITVNEKPIIIASENREICAGDTVHLSAKGALEYSWSPVEGLHNPTIANPIFNGTKTTEYIVTGKNGNCSDSKKVIITVNNKPTLSVSENREICAGDTVHLSAKGALEYSWSPAEGLNNPTIANPIFTGTKTTEYIVTGKTGNCFDSKKILITVNEKPPLTVSENREICAGDTVHLHANSADSYLWTPSTYLNNATINNPIAQPTENITYTVRGMNTNGCYEEKTISITINNDQEKTISLQLSDTAHYAPGSIVPVKIVIPAGLAQITATLNYDPCCVRCDSIFTPNNGVSTVFLRNNALRFTSISPNKESREIMLPCTIYLPPDGRKSEKFTLSDIIHSEQCLIVRGNNDEILYDPSCAWQFRGVQQTGRFGIESDGTIARLYTGYGGAITVKIFDLTGVELWHYSSHYISTDIQEISLPTLSSGMYIMQASNGVWHDECVMMK